MWVNSWNSRINCAGFHYVVQFVVLWLLYHVSVAHMDELERKTPLAQNL